jgi:hypothetical protein
MVTYGKSRATSARNSSLAPRLLLTLLLCCILALGMSAASPAVALTLGGSVALDTNGNGIADVTDSPIPGVTVSVQPSAGGVAASTTTGVDGRYSFPGLAANTYTVTVGGSPGALNETPASMSVTLSADRNDIDFLFVVPGLIGGRVVSDLNGNGIADPNEPGLTNVTVALERLNEQGVFVAVTTVATGPDGSFFFPLQPAGTYRITETDPTGLLSSGATAGSMGAATVVDPNTVRVVFNGGQAAAGLRFLDRSTQPSGGGGISGTVYDDTNRSGAIEPGTDQPVPNVMVELRDAAQNLLASTLTDATGGYLFTSVASGATYVVRIQPPANTSLRLVSPTAPATAAGTSGILVRNFNPGTVYASNNFLVGPSTAVSPETPGSANAISGKVFNDLNGDGLVSGGESGLAGATLTLVSTTGVAYGTQTTNATGDFIFVNLPAGEYVLTETDPPGFVSTGVQPGVGGTSTSVNTIRITVTGTNNLFSGHIFLDSSTGPGPGPGLSSISGSVFRDTNGNGFIDGADLGISGVQVVLQTSGGAFLAQTFTGLNGTYAFGSLTPGTYRVVEVDPANHTSVAAFPGAGGFALDANTIQITTPPGGASVNNNFLDRSTVVSPTVGSISGQVWRDLNGNNVIDAGDVTIQGVTVQLFVLGNAFPSFQTTTDANGAYSFVNLPPGFYRVVELDPANHTSVAAFAGVNGAVVNANTIQVSVVAGVNSSGNNFLDRLTAVSPTTGSISGSVLRDTNGNSVIDAGDVPISGVTVQLFVLGNAFPSFQTTTAANGTYAFNNLPPGFYRVVELDPSSHTSVAAFAGFNAAVVDANTIQVTVQSGVNSGNNNFLDRLTVVSPTGGSISGNVLRDTNGNGFIDAGDVGIAGVTVQLFVQGNAFPSFQTTTAANGAYAFNNLPSGFYRVVELDPANHTSVGASAGVNAFVVDANTIQVQVVSGVNSGNNNFLDRLNAPAPGSNTISGFAIRDVNLNGSASGEPGLAGMTVVLSDQFGTPLASVVTDVTGAFSFTGLQGGTYTLTATPPFGLNSTNAIVGQNGLRLSPNSIRVTTSFGLTNYPGQLFLAGP